MRILLYEFVTAGGLFADFGDGRLPESLQAEARAMIGSLAADMAALPGVTAWVLRDTRLAHWSLKGQMIDVPPSTGELDALRRWSAECDWTLVIAPEWRDTLRIRAQSVVEAGGQLLGPSPERIALAADKHATAEFLSARGIAVPDGVALAAGDPLPEVFPLPAVLKPRDGAGSDGVQLLRSQRDLQQARPTVPARLESFCPGIAASVAILGHGDGRCTRLPACRQHLSADGSFKYLGGSLPLPADLAARAQRLADQVAAALPPWRGYLGIDLVLGEDEAAGRDVVIEINPRLTTSYVGLRAMAAENLAGAMLALASGRPAALCFHDTPIQFTADGKVRVAAREA